MNPPASSAAPEAWLELPGGEAHWLKARCSIGRQVDNDLVLDLPALSRHHALLTASGGRYLLSDLHSRNGTYLGHGAVTRPMPVADGDEIRFGDVVVRFRCKRRWFQPQPAPADSPASTQRLDQMRERVCWLLLVDVAGYTTLNDRVGSENAARQLQAWITGMRPLIEEHGGAINGYLGDAIFAYWLADAGTPPQPLDALRAIETWRPASPLPFRVVLHHGAVLFTHGDRGEELTGQEVNLVFRAEKIAKGFDSRAMLTLAAVTSLELEGRCPPYGRSAVDGMTGFHSFYGLPPDFASARAGTG